MRRHLDLADMLVIVSLGIFRLLYFFASGSGQILAVILHSLGRPRADTVETSTESHLSKLPAKYFRGDGPKFSLVNWIFVIAYWCF